MPHMLNDEEGRRRIDEHRNQISGPGPGGERDRGENRVAPREQPELAPADTTRLSIRAASAKASVATAVTIAPQPRPWRASHQPSASSASPAAGHRASRLSMRGGRAAAATSRDAARDDIERRRENEQRQAPAPSQPRAKQTAPASVSASAAQISQAGRTAVSIKPLGHELLDQRKEVAAGPVGARAARRGDQGRAENPQAARRARPAAARRPRRPARRSAPSWIVRRSKVDWRSQSPSIAAVEPRICASTSATPAQRDWPSIRSNAACASSSGTVATAGSGSSASAATSSAGGATPSPIMQDHRPGLEPADRLAARR